VAQSNPLLFVDFDMELAMSLQHPETAHCIRKLNTEIQLSYRQSSSAIIGGNFQRNFLSCPSLPLRRVVDLAEEPGAV
jgi:hypothetical protein